MLELRVTLQELGILELELFFESLLLSIESCSLALQFLLRVTSSIQNLVCVSCYVVLQYRGLENLEIRVRNIFEECIDKLDSNRFTEGSCRDFRLADAISFRRVVT